MPILILQYCFNNLVKLYIQTIQISPAFIVLFVLVFLLFTSWLWNYFLFGQLQLPHESLHCLASSCQLLGTPVV